MHAKNTPCVHRGEKGEETVGAEQDSSADGSAPRVPIGPRAYEEEQHRDLDRAEQRHMCEITRPVLATGAGRCVERPACARPKCEGNEYRPAGQDDQDSRAGVHG